MATLALTDPVQGTTTDANIMASNNAAIKAVVNGGIDATNISTAATPTITALTITQNAKTALSISGAAAGVTLGGDTNLYRVAANYLKTDGGFQVVGVLNALAQATVSSKLRIGDATTPTTAALEFVSGTTAAAGVNFGGDTNLYRSAAGALKTDGILVVAPATAVTGFQYHPTTTGGSIVESLVGAESFSRFYAEYNGIMHWGSGSAGADTNLYRSAVGILATDQNFTVDKSGTACRLFFGSAGDTSLYRAAAATLQSDNGCIFTGGVVTKTTAGNPADGDLVAGMRQNGAIVVDTVNNKIVVRIGGVWKGVTVA